MDLAIVGLSAAGKTTVFNALTAGHGSAVGGAEQIGSVKIPDERLEKLAALVKAKKITPVEVTLHDLPALFERGAAPSGPAAETLSRADALLHVVRAFERDDVPHPKGSVDPARDIQAFDDEIAFNDLGIIERRLEKLDTTVRSARPGEREAGEREKALLERCRAVLNEGARLRNARMDSNDIKALGNFGLLSLKPALVLLNIAEADAPRAAALEAEPSASPRPGPQSPRSAPASKPSSPNCRLRKPLSSVVRWALPTTRRTPSSASSFSCSIS
jgi:ribosome-binding ATPase